MGDLKDSIGADLKQAMRDKDAPRLEIIRMIWAGIQRHEVDERITLNDSQTLAVVEKLVKQARDSIEQFTQGDRDDLVKHETAQLAVLQTYLPEPLSDDEIAKLINQAIADTGASTIKEMGKVIGKLKPTLQGRADMGKVSAQIKHKLSAS